MFLKTEYMLLFHAYIHLLVYTQVGIITVYLRRKRPQVIT